MASHFKEEDFTSEKFSLGVWKKVFKLVFSEKKLLITGIIAILITTVLDILYPLLNAYGLDTFFEKGDFTKLPFFITLSILIALGYGISVWLFIRSATLIESNISYTIKEQTFNKIQELPLSYFDKTPAGWLMARLTSDSRRLASIISWGLIDLLWGFTLMVGILVALFIMNYKLALIILFLLPILLFVSLYFRKKILISYREVRKINSEITSAYNEGILGNQTAKTLVLEEANLDQFDDLSTKMRTQSIRAVLLSSIFFPIMLIISYVAIMYIIRFGGNMVLEMAISAKVLYLFISYSTQFFEPIMQVSRILAELQQAQASAERIISLLETDPEIYDTKEVIEKYGTFLNPKKENWEELIGEIEFRDVYFSYIEGEPILENFNLYIPAGTMVAIVGDTGSGKSTMVNLICRFYEPQSGVILIDGVNYKERSMGWLHSNLGYVLQTPHLFNGSIYENIAYGLPNATLEDVKKAAEIVNADSFINELDNGYDTNVGEGGAKLSEGQKQLISFARAIIRDPKILILDEATSSVDTETEKVLQDIIVEVLKGRTSFVIAHRLSTIVDADLILVVKDGKIIEQGNHRELLNLRGEYFDLYKTQFINEKIDESRE